MAETKEYKGQGDSTKCKWLSLRMDLIIPATTASGRRTVTWCIKAYIDIIAMRYKSMPANANCSGMELALVLDPVRRNRPQLVCCNVRPLLSVCEESPDISHISGPASFSPPCRESLLSWNETRYALPTLRDEPDTPA
jgi:hypothetical protein